MNRRVDPLQSAEAWLRTHRNELLSLLHRLQAMGRPFLLRSTIQDTFEQLCAEDTGGELRTSPLATLVDWCQEAALDKAWVCFALRQRVARWVYIRVHMDTLNMEAIDASEFLAFKERLVTGSAESDWMLEVDLEPFSRHIYKLHESDSIGRGVEFLNRHLSSQLFQDLGKGDQRLLDFLRVHKYRDQQLMLNDAVENVADLRLALRQAETQLRGQDQDASWDSVAHDLRSTGFEPGWGRTGRRIRESMELLSDILEAPDPGGDPFGYDRLVDLLRRSAGSAPDAVIGQVLAEVEAHHGRIEVESEVGAGTVFTLELPLKMPPMTVVPPSAISTLGFESDRPYCISSVVHQAFMPTTAAPIEITAQYPNTHSG